MMTIMRLRPSDPIKELVALYSRAQHSEHNIGEFFGRHPALRDRFGVPDVTGDDAELALQLAVAIGRYKKATVKAQQEARAERAVRAVRRLIGAARRCGERVDLDIDVLLGDVLIDTSKEYICFELDESNVDVPRHSLARARGPTRSFDDVIAYVDRSGLHLRWRAGRGGLNFQPQRRERGAQVLVVDLRAPLAGPASRCELIREGEILADMALI